MDKNIKEDNPNVSQSDLSSLVETNSKIGIKSRIVDDRYDDINLIGKEDFYKNTFNRRPSYPWEDTTLKERKYSDEEIKKIKTVYSDKKQVEKITLPSATLSKAVVKNKGQIVSYQPSSGYKNGSSFAYSNDGKHDYSKSSYPNGWPISPTENSSERVTIKIPGIKSSFVVRDVIKPIFYNFIYDFHNTVEDVNTLVPVNRGKNLEETKQLAASGKVKMIQGDGGWNFRKIRESSKWSAHASATAIDINWNFHWMYWRNTFSPSQQTQIRKLTTKYGLTWGGDYTRRADDMHFEIKVSPSVVNQIIESNGLVDRMSKIASGIKVKVD
jgi:hypothetical protein